MPVITEDTPQSEITIQGITFTAPEPYESGHVLNENEAAAINQLFHENLRNNFASKVKTAIDAASAASIDVDLDTLQKEFDAYAAGYAFGVRKSGVRVPRDPVAREAQRIARASVMKVLKQHKLKLEDLPEGKMEAMVAALIDKDPKILELAQAEVSRKAATAEAIAGIVANVDVG